MTLLLENTYHQSTEEVISLEPWSYRREVWLRWLNHHRPNIQIRSIPSWDSYCKRTVEQFLPRMNQYPNQGNFYSYRYHETRRLFLISQEDTRIYERIMVGHILKSHEDCRIQAWPYDTWFQHYETPELTLDRYRSYLSGKALARFISPYLSKSLPDVPLYHEFAGPGPRWYLHDDEGKVLLNKDGRPTPMFAGGSGVEYFISPTGSDSNTGTQGSPWLTYSKFYSNPTVQAGDILTMLGGNYSQTFNANASINKDGVSPLIRTTVRPFAGASVTVTKSSGGVCFHFQGRQHQYWEVGRTGTPLILTCNSGLSEVVSPVAPDNPIWRNDGLTQFIRGRNIEAHHNGGYGMQEGTPEGALGDNEFFDCNIHNNGHGDATLANGSNSHGLYMFHARLLVEGATINNNLGYGLHINTSDNTGVVSPDIVIRRGKFYANCTKQQVFEGGAGAMNAVLSGVLRPVMYNCLAYRCTPGNGARGGIQIGASLTTNASIYNCTAAFNTGGAGQEGFQSFTPDRCVNALIRNCVAFGNDNNFQDLSAGQTTQDHNSFSGVDPRFVNSAINDFHLLNTSPLINTGVTIGVVTTDYDQVARPQGGAYDIGAYEFVGSVDLTPPATPIGLQVI